VNWLSNLFGKNAASAEPWSFPRRIEGLADTLAMTVFEHEIARIRRSLPCWTFVSDGLLAHGQKEMMLTVARTRGEHPDDIAREVARFLVDVYRLAGQGRRVDEGGLTIFRSPGPAGADGIAYIRPEPMAGVEAPLSVLAAIPLMGAEAQVARDFGVTRVLARLARHYRYYPCPPWWERGRSAVAALPGDDTSVLTQMEHVRVVGVTARMEAGQVRLRVHPAAREELHRTLTRAPRNAALALLTDPDVEADGLLVWTPGVEGREAATPAASRGERLGFAFVSFAVGVEQVGGRIVEDGVVLMFTAPAWEAFTAALAAGTALTLSPTAGNIGLELHWIPDRYVSPVDGRGYNSEGGWRRYYPPSPVSAEQPRVADRIVLLTSSHDLAGRVAPELLAGYVSAIEREFVRTCGTGPGRVEIFVRIELRPEEPARVVGRGDLDETRIAALIGRVAAPAVIGGSVAFECRLTTPPKAS